MGVVKSSRHGAYADVHTHISLFFSFLYFFKAFIAKTFKSHCISKSMLLQMVIIKDRLNVHS